MKDCWFEKVSRFKDDEGFNLPVRKTNFSAGYSDSPLSSEMAVLDENDPYCTSTECINSKAENDLLNDYLRTNYTFGESTSGCI